MAVYYNEWEPFAAQWLRNLIKAGLLPDGDVDERSITEVHPLDVDGYDACHFFCGIGGWPLAGRLAGLPDDFRWWSGSAPCQPFSHAGSEKGFADERHLWPAFYGLIKECRPERVFGEQVENAIRHGWLDLILSDLEAEDYACGAVVLPACGVGAPHKRQRLYWAGALGDPTGFRRVKRWEAEGASLQGESSLGEGSQLKPRSEQDRLLPRRLEGLGSTGSSLGDTDREGLEGREGLLERSGELSAGQAGMGFWTPCEWVKCRDGCLRPVEPGTSPLAHGVPQIVGQLRAYGNALVPPLAAEFIKSILD
jgi:DNA (cytosine-5)-methyltransferase 1